MTEITLQHGPDGMSTVRLAAEGDEIACARLVTDHYASMVRAAFVIVGDSETAREAVQLAWSIAWRKMGSIRDPRAGPALAGVHRCQRGAPPGAAPASPHLVEISAGVGERSRDPGDGIDLLDLGRALRGLKPEERSLLALRYVAGLDSNQIGQQTGMSASGVRSRLARVLDRLREELGDA